MVNRINVLCSQACILSKLGPIIYFYKFSSNICILTKISLYLHSFELPHPATRRRGVVVATSLCTSQQRLRYVSNETPNGVSMARHQSVSMVRTHNVLLVRLYDVFCNSQIKHPMRSLWYVFTTSRSYIVAAPYLYCCLYYVFK